MNFHRYKAVGLDSVYGSANTSTKLSEQGKAVLDLIKEMDIPIYKDAKLRAMLLELDAYKNMPTKYFTALSDVLAYAVGSKTEENPYGDKANA